MTSADQEMLEIRAEFVDESLEGLSKISELLVELEQTPANIDIIQSIFRPIHSIKGNAAYFEMMSTKELAHEMETLLDLMRKGSLIASPVVIGILLKGTDALAALMTRARRGDPEAVDAAAQKELIDKIRQAADEKGKCETALWFDLFENLKSLCQNVEGENHSALEKLRESATVLAEMSTAGRIILGEIGNSHPGNLPQTVAAISNDGSADKTIDIATKGGAGEKKADDKEEKSMRIPEKNIDEFLSYVGELVTIGEMYNHLYQKMSSQKQFYETAVELRRVNEAFGELSRSLQSSIMNVRRVSLRSIFQRLPRIIRDIANNKGKSIETHLLGQDILIDKSHSEVLEAPLVHMVRNAADHGIESAEERTRAGKPPQGTITIEAVETKEKIIFNVVDDGRGIDRESLARKAVELGLISGDTKLSEEAVVDLLFKSGVSTAKEITDISGRGVGLDVVKKNIESMGGEIVVSSNPGKGSSFRLSLPKTVSTQILTGFIVADHGNRYVFPMDRVVRCFALNDKEISTVRGSDECVRNDDRMIPLYRLSKVLGLEAADEELCNDNIEKNLRRDVAVVVSAKGKTIALQVDEIEGVQQVVQKELNGLKGTRNIFQGGAVMGDGRISMILDVGMLV